MIPVSSHCDNEDRSLQCYNSYQDSEVIGLYSHFTCPRACVSLMFDMCRGISWCCSDVRECGPQLKCPDSLSSVKLNTTSSLAPDHHVCVADIQAGGNILTKIQNKNHECSEEMKHEYRATGANFCSKLFFCPQQKLSKTLL